MTSDVPLLSMSLDHYLYLCYLDMQSFLCRFFLFCIFTSFVLALKSKSFSKLTLIKTNKKSSFISLYYCYTTFDFQTMFIFSVFLKLVRRNESSLNVLNSKFLQTWPIKLFLVIYQLQKFLIFCSEIRNSLVCG